MRNRLTQKQETFCLKYFELGNASQAAIIAGYSNKSNGSIRNTASVLLTKSNIQKRLAELRKPIEDESVMSRLEIKQKLTKMVREGDDHNVRGAIDIDNKMEHRYELDSNINILNQILNVNVVSESARKATERIVQGERTE